MQRFRRLLLVSSLLLSASAGAELQDQPVRIRLMHGESAITLRASAPIHFEPADTDIELSPGVYTITAGSTTPPRQRFHLFAKTFRLDQRAEERAYLSDLRAQGGTPEVITIGKRLETISGRILDTRVHWVSIQQIETEEEAETTRARLAAEGRPVWVQREILEPGTGFVRVSTHDGAVVASFDVPLTIRSAEAIAIDNVDRGFWDEKREHLSYTGDLHVRVGPENGLDVIEILPIEDYLRGVLPAEMPSLWKPQALMAQAVTARSEVMSNLGSRYALEGFDFLGNEQSRAYLGAGGFKAETDRALALTAGLILTQDDRIVPAVFSATCGGWTENNDTVWYGPPDAALRGVSGAVRGARRVPESVKKIGVWLREGPRAYCSRDESYFRWTRSYSETELHDMINSRHDVGRIDEIQLGDRGVSGRLKWVRIHGSQKTETIHKELPIRLAFGGLPSAFFVLETKTAQDGTRSYVFTGGGRGHGVGMCQHGAQGMAEAGMTYRDILRHFFTGVTIERCR